MLELYHEPWKNIPYLFTDTNVVDWKGTIGVGDILFGLNAVHMMVHMIRKHRPVDYITMNVHWPHDEDYLHHYEDPETIIERCDYLHNMYHDKDSVRVNHIFNSDDREIMLLRHRGFQRLSGVLAALDGLPSWILRKDLWVDSKNSKDVVFWRPLFNAETPASWKRSFTNHDWERILDILESKGYNMIELSYRTPVREALYHIRHCRFCIFYDGMWQYIAKNLCKPVIALGNSGILKVHNPQGIHFQRANDRENDLFRYIKQLPHVLEHMDRRAKIYEDFLHKELEL